MYTYGVYTYGMYTYGMSKAVEAVWGKKNRRNFRRKISIEKKYIP